MNQPSHSPPLEEKGALEHAVESFWGAALRRTRYAFAITLSATLFIYLGWQLVNPPPEVGGLSLLYWPGHSSVLAVIGLAGILMLGTGLCSWILHPDSPHAGLFCALLGMSAVAIRAGTSHDIIYHAQSKQFLELQANAYPLAMQRLSLECVYWGILFLIAEAFARLVHERFFTNNRWITRIGPEAANTLAKPRVSTNEVVLAWGIALTIARSLGTLKLPRLIATPIAVIANVFLGGLLLYATLQSQSTGQVFFACFASFLISTTLVYLAFPRVPAIAFFLAVPLVGAIGYYHGSTQLYGLPAVREWVPGLPGYFIARALPVDFITMGIPGAIMGYYIAFSWSLQTHESS